MPGSTLDRDLAGPYQFANRSDRGVGGATFTHGGHNLAKIMSRQDRGAVRYSVPFPNLKWGCTMWSTARGKPIKIVPEEIRESSGFGASAAAECERRSLAREGREGRSASRVFTKRDLLLLLASSRSNFTFAPRGSNISMRLRRTTYEKCRGQETPH